MKIGIVICLVAGVILIQLGVWYSYDVNGAAYVPYVGVLGGLWMIALAVLIDWKG